MAQAGKWPVCQQVKCVQAPASHINALFLQVHCNVPEWMHDVFKKRRWAVARLVHTKIVPCNSNIPLFNTQTGKQTFKSLHDAKAVRDRVYDIRKVSLVLVPI